MRKGSTWSWKSWNEEADGGHYVSNALLRSKNTEHNSFPQSSASWQSCAYEMRAEVVDFPEVKPNWYSDNGEKIFK